MSISKAASELKTLPFHDMGFAKIDRHRAIRRGYPEVVFGQGKNPDDIVRISRSMIHHHRSLLVTRVDRLVYEKLKREIPGVEFDSDAGMVYFGKSRVKNKGLILVVTAGTSDYKVAREAALTAEVMGNKVKILADVGVAGVHRLIANMKAIRKANVLIVIAGMEGALASVVSGLVNKPVIAVPTSVGYGASFKGIAPLLAMLNSCSPGVTVVNIDNGFGAGYFASLINK